MTPTIADAVVTPDRLYRYRLDRRWASGPRICWVMLNPSTADANKDDMTLRLVRGYSQRWGFGALIVVNLFALRATNPDELLKHSVEYDMGPQNMAYVEDAMTEAERVMAAWGTLPRSLSRMVVGRITAMAYDRGITLHALGITKDGSPRHPRFVKADVHPMIWREGRRG